MEKVPPPCEGYAPLEKAWRCIFPFDEECKGNIRRGRRPDMDRSLGDTPGHQSRQITEVLHRVTHPRSCLILLAQLQCEVMAAE
jgi:hypothetical protein